MKKRVLSLSLILILVLSLASCSSYEKKIIGEWKTRKTTLGIVTESSYTFNEDGSGVSSGPLGLSLDMNYIITDSTITFIYFEGDAKVQKVYAYTLEKDKLTLIDGDESTIYTRVTADSE